MKIAQDPASRSAGTAAKELWAIDKKHRGILVGLLSSKQREVLFDAVEALGEIGAEAKDALPELTKVQKHTDLYIRIALRRALRKINSGAAP